MELHWNRNMWFIQFSFCWFHYYTIPNLYWKPVCTRRLLVRIVLQPSCATQRLLMCYLCCGLLVLLSRGFCSCNECNLAKSAYLAARKWLNRSVWCRTLFNISTNYSKSFLARLNTKRGIITSICDRLVFKCSVVDSWEKVTDIGRLVKRDCELHRR